MALLSVAVLVLAGLYLAWTYVGTWNGLYGTSYGVLLLAKIYLLLVMLLQVGFGMSPLQAGLQAAVSAASQVATRDVHDASSIASSGDRTAPGAAGT